MSARPARNFMSAALLAMPAAWAESPAAAIEPVTYAKHISRLVQKRCETCHRTGGIGPFTMRSHAEVKSHAKMIKEVVTTGRMPPWFADAEPGHFRNDARLTQAEKDMLVGWIDGGMPKGDDADLPDTVAYNEEWMMGEPDVVYDLPEEYDVPATGVMDYKYLVTPTGFTEDKWVSAMECKPGAAKVVHHIIVYLLPAGIDTDSINTFFEEIDPDSAKEGSRDGALGFGRIFLNGFAPGVMPTVLDDGLARRIPAGSSLLWEVHYTPNGKPEKDRSKFALRFATAPVKREFLTATPGNDDFVIPAGHDNYPVASSMTFPEAATVYSFTPHMHLRGKAFKYTLTYPGGREAVVLNVPKYDFNWQLTYELAEPLKIPAGTRLDCLAHFDNSTANPYNPDPTKPVHPGDQTFQEMMIGWMNLSWDKEVNVTTAAAGAGD